MSFRLLGLFLVLASALLRAEGDSPWKEYQARRSALRNELKDGITVLFGAAEDEHGNIREGFFQDANFYYLTGWKQPGAALLLLPDKGDGAAPAETEILFIPSRNPETEKWTGRKTGPEDKDIEERTGFAKVLPAERLESELQKAVESAPKIYVLTASPRAEKLRNLFPLREITDASLPIARLRMKKSSHEIELIRKATDTTVDAFRAGFAMVRPGVYEYQVGAVMSAVYFTKGCERHAYAPILGSGPNSTVLHYSANRRQMDAGEVIVMDVGAECDGYATDITRTVPVNGKFTPRQREIYDIVLGAQKAVIAAIKPGMTLGKKTPNSLYQVAFNYIDAHGKDREGKPLGKYLTHGIGHHVGLDVHDAYDPEVPLAPGMVVTVEPGIYIPEENIGIRIEDMVLVTEQGGKLLSGVLPREPEEIERTLTK